MGIHQKVLMSNGIRGLVIVRDKTLDRLADTCFRQALPLAGNFATWTSASDVLSDQTVWKHLLQTMEELWEEGCDHETQSVQVEMGKIVGWSGTALLSEFAPDDLEPFEPNKRSWGLRVRSDTDHRAPKVSIVTFVFEFKDEDGWPVMVIHSMYPGPDIGRLDGDLAKREGIVFFGWEHPGEA